MFTNILILVLHSSLLSLFSLAALRAGKETLRMWLILLAIGMNLFVLKQITLFGLHVTCSDTLAVGYLLGLNLIQEFFGREEALKTIWITCLATVAFLFLSCMTLLYQPSLYDRSHPLFIQLFLPQLRLVTASLVTFLLVQVCDLRLFAHLRACTQGRFLALRTTCSLLCSQTLDTVLFSFLGLYGMVPSVCHIILFSLLVKWIVIMLSIPYVAFSRRVVYAL